MLGMVCKTPSVPIAGSATRRARSSPRPSGTATNTAAASAIATNSRCRIVSEKIVARRSHRYDQKLDRCTELPAPDVGCLPPTSPKARSSSPPTLLTSSPSTSTRRLSCRIVWTSRRPLRRVSVAIADGESRSSCCDTSAAASYGGKKWRSSTKVTRSYRARSPSVE